MIAAIVFFLFSAWLMCHTFSYSAVSGLLISTHVWSDFGAAIPLIRSFSYGMNWPPQHPLYPGLPIQYHFLFYLCVGLLERIGFRLDYALNLLSSLGFALLLFFVYKLSSKLFSRFWVGVLSVVLFLFNGSFSFLDYLSKYSIFDLPHLTNFVSFAPWNSSIVTAFWSLNIYTNQRHLGFSFALALLIIYYLVFPGIGTYFIGFILGLLYFTNQAAFAISLVFFGWYFLITPDLRKRLFQSLLGLLPFIPFLQYLSLPISNIHYYFGWMTRPPITFINWINFWFYNYGFHLFLIPLGILLAPKKAKLLVPPLFILFFLPNFYQLSIDLVNNHKFFNFFLIIGVMFSSFALSRIFNIKIFGPLLFIPLFLSVVGGGIVDIFPIINDTFITLPDIPQNPVAQYFYTRTPPQSVILNSTWFYHPASLAGRKIFNGYSYFTWSYGYDQVGRENLTASIYSAPDKYTACRLLQDNHISYVELNSSPEGFLHPNLNLWNNEFTPAYSQGNINIYLVSQNCK